MTKTRILNWLSTSYSPYHAVKNVEEELLGQGFIKLNEDDAWALTGGRSYFIKRNDSSIIAFRLPKDEPRSFRIAASHSDSPTFKVKPNPLYAAQNLLMLNVEPYGGGIYHSFMNRPLSLAGRLTLEKEGKTFTKLIAIDEDLLVIPSLAIHMNRDVNKSLSLNPAIDMIPIFGEAKEGFDFASYLLSKAHEEEAKLLGHDLFIYTRGKPKYVGFGGEFLLSPRLDDLGSAYSSLLGFIDGTSVSDIDVYALFDNEEVGSLTYQGAYGTFLKDTIGRICQAMGYDEPSLLARSRLLSIDNAHANHPNHPEYSDKTTEVLLNHGIVIKYNANQKYTTDGYMAAFVKVLCQDDIPYQEYTNRSDLPGGSTLGNLSNNQLSIKSADIGLPQLAMHSAVELMGTNDLESMRLLTKRFFIGNDLK